MPCFRNPKGQHRRPTRNSGPRFLENEIRGLINMDIMKRLYKIDKLLNTIDDKDEINQLEMEKINLQDRLAEINGGE